MTEDDARTRWCPESRLHVSGWAAAPYNRFLKDDDHDTQVSIPRACKCIASECAWWVHEKSVWCHPDGREPTKEELHEHISPESAGLITVKFGHCGAIKS